MRPSIASLHRSTASIATAGCLGPSRDEKDLIRANTRHMLCCDSQCVHCLLQVLPGGRIFWQADDVSFRGWGRTQMLAISATGDVSFAKRIASLQDTSTRDHKLVLPVYKTGATFAIITSVRGSAWLGLRSTWRRVVGVAPLAPSCFDLWCAEVRVADSRSSTTITC